MLQLARLVDESVEQRRRTHLVLEQAARTR